MAVLTVLGVHHQSCHTTATVTLLLCSMMCDATDEAANRDALKAPHRQLSHLAVNI